MAKLYFFSCPISKKKKKIPVQFRQWKSYFFFFSRQSKGLKKEKKKKNRGFINEIILSLNSSLSLRATCQVLSILLCKKKKKILSIFTTKNFPHLGVAKNSNSKNLLCQFVQLETLYLTEIITAYISCSESQPSLSFLLPAELSSGFFVLLVSRDRLTGAFAAGDFLGTRGLAGDFPFCFFFSNISLASSSGSRPLSIILHSTSTTKQSKCKNVKSNPLNKMPSAIRFF